MLVGTGEEHHLVAGHSLIASHGVRGHGTVGVADMQLIAGVINRCSNIKALIFHGLFILHL